MLKNQEVDAAIADFLILKYYKKQVFEISEDTIAKTIEFFYPFCPTPYSMIFRNAELRNQFNNSLNNTKSKITEINKKYGMDYSNFILPKNCDEAS